MSWISALAYRLRGMVRADLAERETDAEFRFHMEMEMRANLNRGLEPDDAARRAQADFGDQRPVRDALRDARGAGTIAGLLQDARFALRRIWHERSFSLLVILTLSLGIGWATAIFSVVDTAFLRPLAYPNPEQLVHLWGTREGTTMNRGELSPTEVFELGQQRLFTAVGGYRQTSYSLAIDGAAQGVPGVRASANLFSMLGARATLGRLFSASDDRPGAPMTVVLSNDAWRNRFGASNAVIGRVVSLDGTQATIVGVLPVDFRFVLAADAQFWTPIQLDPAADPSDHWVRAVARLRPGVSVDQAHREFDATMKRMAAEHPQGNERRAGNLVSLREEMVGRNDGILLMLLIGAAALLVTGCANVAGLLLARVAGRGPELAVRRALGADATRIINQVLVENLTLALIGGVVGVGIAYLALRLLVAQIPAGLLVAFPFVAGTTIDMRVIGLALLLSLATGLLCGLAPAIAAGRHAPAELLRASARSMTARSRWRLVLVAVQLALTFLLVGTSSLLGRSLTLLFNTDVGYRTTGELTFGVSLDGARYQTRSARSAAFGDIERRLRALPGVDDVAVGSDMPFDYGIAGAFTLPDGVGSAAGLYARFRWVEPGYFAALGIPLGQGRNFLPADTLTAGGVIVSASLMRQFASDGARLGAMLGTDTLRKPIVGVVGDVRLSVDQDPTPTIYLPLVPGEQPALRFALRTRGDASALTTDARRAITAVDPQLMLSSPRTTRDALDNSRPMFFRRFPLLITSLFSAVGITLAAIGLFGVVAYAVTLRRREFGIRMALGASRVSVVRLSVREGMQATIAGVIAGIVLIALGSRFLAGVLYGVKSTDLASYALTTGVVFGVAILASVVPARRAVRISPSTAMRDAG